MITLDIIRDALAGSDPYAGIDQLIRAELAQGRTTSEIHATVFPLVRDARRTPGFSDDASEALLGALDALTGNCHPDCRYSDTSTAISSAPANANGVQAPTTSEKV